jgi:hypothetical protein
MSITRTCIAALLVVSTSCAHHPPATDTNNELRVVQPKGRRNPNVITEEELQAPDIISRDALTAIRHLRPNFFAYHGPTGSQGTGGGEVKLSHDYGPLQSVETLKAMNTFGVKEVRYLTAEEAGLRFGLNANASPVIVLLSNTNQ